MNDNVYAYIIGYLEGFRGAVCKYEVVNVSALM